MKKIILGLVALIALMATESNASRKLTVFSAVQAPVKVDVTFTAGCDHWTEIVTTAGGWIYHDFRGEADICGWYKFEAKVQLPGGGQADVNGLNFSERKSANDVVVIFGPYNGQYYARRVTDKHGCDNGL